MIKYPIFDQFADIFAFTTTKMSGLQPISRFTGDQTSLVTHSKEQLSRSLGIEIEKLVFPRQTHSANIQRLDLVPPYEITDTDALITNIQGICICVQTADCVPVVLYDPEHHAAAVIHAGWRGTFKEISAKTVNAMMKAYHSSPSEIFAVIGPSIGPRFYEIGAEVEGLFTDRFPDWRERIIINNSMRPHLDLWETNRLQLIGAGLHPTRISVFGKCTYENITQFYSARREGVETGRMATGIILK